MFKKVTIQRDRYAALRTFAAKREAGDAEEEQEAARRLGKGGYRRLAPTAQDKDGASRTPRPTERAEKKPAPTKRKPPPMMEAASSLCSRRSRFSVTVMQPYARLRLRAKPAIPRRRRRPEVGSGTETVALCHSPEVWGELSMKSA